MSAHNIQLFSGSVEIPDDLRVVSLTVEDGLVELGANGAFANVGYVMNNPGGSNAAVYYDKISDQLRVVHTDFGGKEGPNTVTIKNEDITMNVSGNVHADFFRGDGGLLSNLVSDLQSVTAVEANSDQMIILSNATALWANVGNVLVEGNVTAGEFHGDGGWLTNVQTTFEETIVNGNTTSNIVEFHNALSLVTTGNVGIQNVAPLGDLSIGANVVFDDDATDILKVQGNINCEVITIGQWVLGGGGAQGLQQITDTGNTTTLTPQFNNVSTAFVTTSKAGIGIAAPSSDAMLHVDGHVRLGGVADTPDNENIFVRAAGALNIIANHSNTDNATSNLVMKAGEINAASITLAGAVTDDDRQKIVFKTRETEALTIDEFGNANFVSNVVVGTGAKFIGDGSGLTGLVSDLQSVSVGGATTNQTIKFTNATEGANITSNLYVGSNLHLDDVTLAAASVTLQGVTTNGATTTDAITITDTTEATTTSTGALKVSGGIAAAKDIRAANVVVSRVGVGLTAGANPDPAHLVEVDGNVKATNVICESLTLDSVALQTLYSLDQVVNVNNTTSNIVVISNTTPSTSMSTGCLQLSGGLGVNGNVYAQEFVNTNAGGWRLTHTHSTRPTVNGASVGGELTGGNGDVETGFLRLSGGGSTAGTGASKSYIDICGASASTDFANNITFGIKGSEKVRLTDVGLGVGTVSPGYLLDVHGAANVGTLTTTGNVGLGTSSPNTLLELSKATGSATISPTELRLSTTTNAADWSVTDPWARLSFYTDDVTGDAPGVMASVGAVASSANGGENTRLAFFTAEPHVERMCIDRYGNVGVGTASPGQKLSIYTGSTSTSALSFDRYSSGNYRTDIYQNSYGPDFRVGYGAYTPESILYLKRLSDGNKEVEINGNVGITNGNARITRHNGVNAALRLEDQNLTSDGSATRAANLQYNFVLSAPRPGQSENGLTVFINSANRTQDGGASCATIRNDNGPIRLGSVSHNTTLTGYRIFTENRKFYPKNISSYFHRTGTINQWTQVYDLQYNVDFKRADDNTQATVHEGYYLVTVERTDGNPFERAMGYCYLQNGHFYSVVTLPSSNQSLSFTNVAGSATPSYYRLRIANIGNATFPTSYHIELIGIGGQAIAEGTY